MEFKSNPPEQRKTWRKMEIRTKSGSTKQVLGNARKAIKIHCTECMGYEGHPCGKYSCELKTTFDDEVLQGAKQIKKKYSIPGTIKQNFKEQRIEIGNAWLIPEQCLNFIKL